MKAIVITEFGGPEVLQIASWPDPIIGQEELLVKVHATALNRADTLQRKGHYPPPKGESEIPGLEMAGEVIAVGSKVDNWKIGDRVCGLLAGGGYAQQVRIHKDMALPIPTGLSFEQAAAIPEVFLTAFQAIKWLGNFQASETALIHAGASGVGTAALQLIKAIGGKSIVTASAGKHDICLRLGADHAIDYKTQNFEKEVLDLTDRGGVDLILDFIGAPYLERNVNLLKTDGRLIILAFMGGAQAPHLNLGLVLRKRLRIIGSTLRARELKYKIELTQALRQFLWARLESGAIRPIVDSVYDWSEVGLAHRYMEENRNQGKIVLRVNHT